MCCLRLVHVAHGQKDKYPYVCNFSNCTIFSCNYFYDIPILSIHDRTNTKILFGNLHDNLVFPYQYSNFCIELLLIEGNKVSYSLTSCEHIHINIYHGLTLSMGRIQFWSITRKTLNSVVTCELNLSLSLLQNEQERNIAYICIFRHSLHWRRIFSCSFPDGRAAQRCSGSLYNHRFDIFCLDTILCCIDILCKVSFFLYQSDNIYTK